MKRFQFILAIAAVVAVVTVACHTEKFEPRPTGNLAGGDFAPVPAETAIENMYSLMNAAYGKGTRAANRTVADIASFRTPAASTRSGAEGGTSRELAYVVNFAEGGFAVLGARQSVPEVLCITEDGLFEPGEVEELTRELTQEPSSAVISDMIVSTDPIRFIKKEVLAYAMCADTEATIAQSNAPQQWERQNARALVDEGTWTTWNDFTQHGPLLSTLWNQGYPYNKECPPDPQDSKRTSYSGCVAMALIQIIAHNEKPAPTSIQDGTRSNWTSIKDNYYNPSKTAVRTNAQLVIEDDLAGIIHSVGLGVDMKYSYYHGSAASSGKAESYLKTNSIGYKKVTRQIWYNATYITDMLERGLPVYISAAGDGGAHAWVIDGSVHQKRTRVDGSGATHTERRFMLHCNFGWGGTANGYYYSKTFTPNQGPVDTETGVDASKPGANGRNYNRQYQIIQWEP